MAEERIRLDTRLVQLGIASGRERAKELLSAGQVTVNGRVTQKAAAMVFESDEILCDAPSPRYVGRGGYKLEKALAEGTILLDGKVCMDVGASTGGFTDCMLQHGAAHVYAVDVGHDQLHPSLLRDARVTSLEGTDIRSEELIQHIQPGKVDFASVDVSFVSLERVLPSLLPYLSENAKIVCLIKPQFEAGRQNIGKRGIVKDPKVHERVLQTVAALFMELGLGVQAMTYSPITGGEGNIEYLSVVQKNASPQSVDTAAVVAEAFMNLKGKR